MKGDCASTCRDLTLVRLDAACQVETSCLQTEKRDATLEATRASAAELNESSVQTTSACALQQGGYRNSPFYPSVSGTVALLPARLKGPMRKLALLISVCVGTVMFVAPEAQAAPSKVRCGQYHGRNFIICAESGAQYLPYGLPPGKYHNRKLSSASGPCGFLAATRKRYGGDTLRHCERYAMATYGSWERAVAHHKRMNWW